MRGVPATLLLLAACFDPTYPEGRPCSETDDCPPGQECIADANVCLDPGGHDNADLASLKLSAPTDLVPAFDRHTTSYAMNVSLLVQETRVTPIAVHSDASITVNDVDVESNQPSQAIPLELGLNNIGVEVTAPAGNTKTYSIAMSRDGLFAQVAYAKASNTGPDDHFGHSVALDGNMLAVGARYEASDDTGVSLGSEGGADDDALKAGAVYLFRRSAATWDHEAYIKAHNTGADDHFGACVALDGDTLVVGAPDEDSSSAGVTAGAAGGANDGAENAGAVYVFRRAGSTWEQEAFIKAHNTGISDWFGVSVALSGDTLAVGASGEDGSTTGVTAGPTGGADDGAEDAGAVYVFRRTGSTWAQEAYIKAHNTGADDRFGSSVSLDGDLLAVGAWLEDSGENGVATGSTGGQDDESSGAGAVYVFHRTGTTWTQEAYVKAHNSGIDDWFGVSVALSADTLAVGAMREDSDDIGVTPGTSGGVDDDAASAGAVYVFRRSGTTWTQEAYLKAVNTGADDLFGSRVALRRGTLAVGAPGEDSDDTGVSSSAASGVDDDEDGAGAVYLFGRDDTTWEHTAYVKPHNTDWQDSFGSSVAISSDTLVAGAAAEDSGAMGVNGDAGDSIPDHENSGAVYIFH